MPNMSALQYASERALYFESCSPTLPSLHFDGPGIEHVVIQRALSHFEALVDVFHDLRDIPHALGHIVRSALHQLVFAAHSTLSLLFVAHRVPLLHAVDVGVV